MKKTPLLKKTHRSTKNGSLQKYSFLLRYVLVIALILAFTSNVCAQYYSGNGWCFTVLPDGTAELIYPVKEKWEGGTPLNNDFLGYENRIESSLTYPSSVTIRTIEKGSDNKYVYKDGEAYTVTAISNGLSTEQRNAMKSVSLPNTLITIANNTFESCRYLSEITIPESVTSIGISVFANCSMLKKATILNRFITNLQFSGCNSLEDVIISENVELISNYAFVNCTNLRNITVKWQTPLPQHDINTGTGVSASFLVGGFTQKVQLIVPFGTLELYKAAPVWKEFSIKENDFVFATGISLFPNKSVTLAAGSVLLLTATVYPENATDKSLIWTSSNEAVATVDSYGKVTTQASGLAKIAVTTKDGNKTASIDISVFGIAVASVKLNITKDSIPTGSSLQLTATINPSYATDKTIKWTSSNESVASVDSTGRVYGMSEGTTVITAEAANGKKDTCTVIVYRPINDVTIVLPIGGDEPIIIAVELPAGDFVTGSFALTLPEGMIIDIENTYVTESLQENLKLEITPLGNNTWLIELVAAP